MTKIFSVAVLACAVASLTGLSGAAAQNQTVPRVGFVAGAGGYPKMAVTNQAFFDGLADAGYKDGSTMTVVFRTAEGNMGLMPELIKNVLAEKVDYLVVSTSPGCAAAQKAMTTVPVLCISVQDDPIKEGLTSTSRERKPDRCPQLSIGRDISAVAHAAATEARLEKAGCTVQSQ